ncbi:MAG: NMD3-related protein [Patescibacteria group bacterium]|nr:NMD3-related protein [Patescibacteria group bacterium]
MKTGFFKKRDAKSIFKKPEPNGVPKHDEYGRSHKGVAVCKKCHNVLFKKEWHRPGVQLSDQILLARKKGVHFVLCPSCTMIANKQYEGEVMVKNVPEKYEVELVNLIASYNEQAQKRDPQDRVITIEKSKKGYRVTTTENQLAVRLAKKIRSAFSKGRVALHISHSSEPYEVERVVLTFK